MLDTLEKNYIYKEIKMGTHINDKVTVQANHILKHEWKKPIERSDDTYIQDRKIDSTFRKEHSKLKELSRYKPTRQPAVHNEIHT
jgi:hypothetical protein